MSQQQVLDDLKRRVGEEVHLSDWFEVTQQRINAFADATGDHQWIHVDVERARRESPWRCTIAHGYLTLSLYPMLRGLVAPGAGHLSGRDAGDQLRPRQAAISESRPGRQPRSRALHAAQGRGDRRARCRSPNSTRSRSRASRSRRASPRRSCGRTSREPLAYPDSLLLIPARHVRPAGSGLIVRANRNRLRAEGPA